MCSSALIRSYEGLCTSPQGKTYGVAFKVVGETALRYLNCREVELGGYRTEVVSFTPRQGRAFQVGGRIVICVEHVLEAIFYEGIIDS